MSRWWVDVLAAISDRIPLPLVLLVLVLAAGLVGVLWYYFPRWIPRHLPRWRLQRPRLRLRWPTLRWRWRWRRRARKDATEEAAADPASDDADLPDLPVAAFLTLADRFAAEGRYADAVRERLRAIVRDLVERGIVEHRPGWTVTELAGAAAAVRPAVEPPLGEAARIFSDIWYGLHPARAEHDVRMRALTEDVSRLAAGPVPAGSRS
ncbi:MAG TPA: DUF4129 domain-containing protein [Micromonosporaceae bacterium]|nr:DUF4129 domain-containing protein [Micromonosporaceae bacterium]